MRIPLALSFLALAFGVAASEAAEFKSFPAQGGNPALIFVSGKLEEDDEQRFVDIALSTPNALVVLKSDGGNLKAGIDIGRAIRMSSYKTFVPDGARCASACALAWLGGVERVMSAGALVGFHAASNKGDGAVSSAGNALVGAYLNQLKLPEKAVIYITMAQPSEIQWLTFRDAREYGIDVRLLELSGGGSNSNSDMPTPAQGAATIPSPSSRTQSKSLETRRFVERYWERLNDPSIGMAALTPFFTPEVNYYGVMKNRSEVTKEKLDFFERWPVRRYAVDPGSVSINCDADFCEATGAVSWEMTSVLRGRQSSGAADFSLAIQWEGASPAISREALAIKSRKVVASTAPSTQTAQPPVSQGPTDKYGVAEVYQGSPVYPDFKGRDRHYSNYRSRIRDGVANGANFAGKYSLVQIGCGTGCSFAFVTDVSTGQVYSFPRGGEQNRYLRFKFDLRSTLLTSRWFSASDRCILETFAWTGDAFRSIHRKDIGDDDACHVPGLFEDEDWKF